MTGVVFQDFNSNGVRDLTATVASAGGGSVSAAVDRGVAAVTVTAYDAAGANRGVAVTDAFGAYTLTVSGSQADPLRVEFTTLPAGFRAGPRGVDSGTGVQFVPNGSAAGVNFAVARPADHSQDDPLVATSVYAYGDQAAAANATRNTLVAFPYSSGGTTTAGFVTPGPATPAVSVPASRVGTTFGLGWGKDSRDLFASAYFKRHAGFGPDGTGAIYRVPVPATLPAGYQPPAGSLLYADLNALFGANTAGANQHNTADYDTDNGNAGWAAVGTTSLGGLDVSDDGRFLFVMNLADRQLYRVPTDATPTAANVVRVSIPLGNPDAAVVANFNANDLRPFAVEYHDGKVYVGVVNTAQTYLAGGATRQNARDQLLAAVYVVDPVTMTFTATPVFTARLNYAHNQPIFGGVPATWEPWSPTYFTTGTGSIGTAPQPMLSGITFDAQGNLTLGVRDRGSDQNGFFSFSDPTRPAQRIEGFTAGDTLRATVTTVGDLASGWTLEDNARVPNNLTASPATLGSGPQSNNSGPGGGEFFFDDRLAGFHNETSMGGTAQLPGSPDVLSTTMDPGDQTRAGGLSFFSTLTGGKVKAYELYHTTGASLPTQGTFGKANGMGELVILSDPATIEVGNRVFLDANGDGVQGAGEPGIAGVTVSLYGFGGEALLGTAVTDAAGNYIFSNAAGTSTASVIFGVTGLTANTPGYSLRLDNPADYAAGGPLAGRFLTKPTADATANGTARDSDATLPTPGVPVGVGNFPQIDFVTGASGENVHTYDAGFTPPLSLGNRVFLDANNNGLRDGTPAEGGVPGVTVTLFTAAGVSVGAAVTDANGYYLFTGLSAGGYYVELSTIPNGLRSSTGSGVTGGVAGVAGVGPFEGANTPSADTNVDDDDNGTQAGAIVRSTVVTLALATEPVREGDTGPQPDTAPDDGSNLTLDLGLIRTFSLGNRVWNDANNDGLLNTGEAGINGVTVRLLQADGTPVQVGGVDVTATTAGGGYYRFDGLTAGDYRVQVDGGGPLAGYRSSSGTNGSPAGPAEPGVAPNTDADSDDNGTAFGANVRSGVVTLGPTNVEPTTDADRGPGDAAAAPDDQSNLTVDFGFYQPLNLGDLVWNDRNNNGVRDAGEPGLVGVPVRLFDSLGGLVSATSTDANGTYTFGNLTPGGYTVEADLPAGFVTSTGANGQPTGPSEPAPGPDTDVDNDDNGTKTTGQTVRSGTVTLSIGGEPTGDGDGANGNLTVDFGAFVPLSLGNLVWTDANNSGRFDAGEKGIPGVVVSLYADADGNGVADGAALASATTDANGNYLFTGLGQGTYVVGLPTGGALAGLQSSSGTPGSLSGPFEPAPGPNGDVNDDDNGSLVGVNYFSGTVTLTPGGEPDAAADGDGTDGNLTVDFGFFQPLSLGNLVWNDFNNDGLVNNKEAGFANVTVRLLDAAGKSVIGVGGVPITTTTNASGQYLFTNLGAGSYVVEVVAPAGYSSSLGVANAYEPGKDPAADATDDDDNGTSAGGQVVRSLPVTLAAGTAPTGEPALTGLTDGVPDSSANYTVDFGLYTPPPLSLGNRVWDDANNNGRRDPGEPGVAGVTVTLFNGAGTSVGVTTTDANGYYLFTNLTPGSYFVELSTLPAGFASSTGAGPTGLAGFGPFEGVNTPSADTNTDDDDNGTQVGAVVRSTTVTLTPFLEPAGESDVGPQPNAAADNNGNLTLDLGLTRVYSLGNRVWNDANNDGRLTGTEAGIDGVTVRLLKADGSPVLDAANSPVTATTAGGGYYRFDGLTAGDYRVQVDRAGPLATFLSSSGTNGSFTGPAEPGFAPNGDIDSDDNGTAFGANFRSAVVTLGPGSTEPTGESDVSATPAAAPDDQSNLTVDFGFYQPLALGNLVWNDLNNNGRVDPGEPGLPNVPVLLLDAAGNLVTSTATDAGGNYLFTDLTAGTYTVTLTPPAGFTSSTGGSSEPAPSPDTDIDGDDNGTQAGAIVRSLPVTLTVGGEPGGNVNATVDFGLTVPPVVPPIVPPVVPPIVPPVVPPVVPPAVASVSGFTYRDNDLTATYTPGPGADTPIGNVTVTLTGTDRAGNRVPPRTTTTNAQGFYEFTNLPPGDYTVTETPPHGFYYHGADNPGSLGGTSPATRVLTVRLDPNDAGRGYNFGELTPADPFGTVYVDGNTNGVRDPGEPGIPGVPVTISGTAFAGTPFARPLTPADVPGGLTSVTNPAGRWEFPVMPPGLYSVVEGAVPAPFTDGLEQNGDPTAPPPRVGNDRFDDIALPPQGVRGPFNFGEVVPESTKRNFLASTPGAAAPGAGATPTRSDVPLNPAFTVTTGRPGTPAYVAVASGPGSLPLVRVFDYATGGEVLRFLAYESDFTGGVRVATGDVNGDGVPDIVTGIGVGGGPRIRVFDGVTGAVLFDQFVYEPSFTGGLFVAAADVNGDGRADIVTGTDTGGGPRVRVLDGTTGAVLQDFFAFDPSQRGGVRVATADFDGDGRADVVATTGPGVPTRVRVFGAGRATTVLADFAPYGGDFVGGVFVAAGDVTGDGVPDIVTGADAGGGPHVQVFRGLTGQSARSFFAYESTFTGGVRVSVRDIDGDGRDDIVTAAGVGGGPAVRVVSGATGAQLDAFYATDPGNLGGVYVG